MTRITASAVKLKNGMVFVGKRHGDAMRHARNILDSDIKNLIIDDGFITSDLRFLNRFEAYKLAKENGQFRRDYVCGLEELFSEDLW